MTVYEVAARMLAGERERCARLCDAEARRCRLIASVRRERDEQAVMIHHAISAELCAEMIRIPADAEPIPATSEESAA